MTLFGRNSDTASSAFGDMPISTERFHTVADKDGDLAVYDSHTGLFAPFLGDTALDVAADFNAGTEDLGSYHWQETL